MNDIAAIENRATISRTTAGVYRYHGVDPVAEDRLHRYSRDVHSPAIARRPGIHLYRHLSWGAVYPGFLPAVAGIRYDGTEEKRVTGAGHLDYLDQRALNAFYQSPDPEVRDRLLADLHILGGAPGRTTTYRTTAGNAFTFLDSTDDPAPQGVPAIPRYGVFLRARDSGPEFRATVCALARAWSRTAGVRRVRMHLFDAPDMSVESAHGYPVHPAPPDEHYQGWIDLVVDEKSLGATLPMEPEGRQLIAQIREIHVQPVEVTYTYVWAGVPTVVGLRGFPAWKLITELLADNQLDPTLLRWMYGPAVDGVQY